MVRGVGDAGHILREPVVSPSARDRLPARPEFDVIVISRGELALGNGLRRVMALGGAPGNGSRKKRKKKSEADRVHGVTSLTGVSLASAQAEPGLLIMSLYALTRSNVVAVSSPGSGLPTARPRA